MTDDYIRRVATEVLRTPHRRFVLSHLNGQDEPVTTRRLAQAVVEWESAGEDETPGGEDVESVMLRLHHEHLPFLDDVGILTYDWHRREVRDWRHPNLGEAWVSSFPLDHLYEVVE